MPSENVIETDVLVIGGSMSGLFAAIKAREEGANVTLVDKGYASRSGAAVFALVFSVFNPEWGHNLNEWMAQIAKAGDYMNNPEWTEITLKDSYDRYQELLSWGIPFLKGEDGQPIKTRIGALEFLQLGPGWTRLSVMRKQALKIGVKIMDRIMITDLAKQDGRVIGAVGFNTISGDFHVFQAKATVMCTGTGALGGFEHVGSVLTYDGETMAYKVGAEISSKEFSLTGAGPFSSVGGGHPGEKKDDTKISLKGKEIKVVPEGFHPVPIDQYVDAEGNKVSRNTAAAVVHSGRGPILWNLDAATPEEIRVAQWGIDQSILMKRECEIDLTKGGLYLGTTKYESYIGHAVEGGGVGIWSADTKGSTSLPGLYAAGDCYHSGAVGAKYPGFGMGTRNAAVTGARAGRSAAEYASKMGKTTMDQGEIARLKSSVYAPIERPGGFDSDWVITQLKSIMVPYYIWIIRHGDRLKAALTLVEFLKNHVVPKMYARPRDAHGLRIVHETKGRVLNVEMMLRSAIFRTESRGNHYREDYPWRDDPNWLAFVKLREKESKMELVKVPFPKEWWPDLSTPYAERYPFEFLGEESVRHGEGSKPF